MVELSARDVAEFRAIYRAETGKDITDEEARAYAERLIRLIAFATGVDPHFPSE
jgi:hypothetical protein